MNKNQLSKNLSIGNIGYENTMSTNNTTQHKNAPQKINLSANFNYPAVPSSVKHSSKPSTASSSVLKNQINQAMKRIKYRNDNLKISSRLKAPYNSGIQQRSSNSIAKFKKSSDSKSREDRRKSAQNVSSVKNVKRK